MTVLIINYPPGTRRREVLEEDEIRIGRAVVNEISIVHQSVSRAHARLKKMKNHYEIEDLGSRNGVRVNDRLITEPTPLHDGDLLLFGDVEVEVRCADSESAVRLSDAFQMHPKDTEIIRLERSGSDPMIPRAADDETANYAAIQQPYLLSVFFEEVTDAVIRQRPSEEVIEEIVDRGLQIISSADRVCLLVHQDGQPVARMARNRQGNIVSMDASRTVVRHVIETGTSVRTQNAQQDARFSATMSVITHGIYSVMCVPLIVERQIVGALYADTLSPTRTFSGADLRVFAAIGNIAAGYLERQRLMEEGIKRRIIDEQLKRAAETQRRLLRIAAPAIPGYQFNAHHLPCQEVGGDYVDILTCGDKLVLVIGDVSGKGLPAAILMGTLQAAVHAQARTSTDVLDFTRQLNSFLYDRTETYNFATLFIGCLDPSSGNMTYINAGHDPALLFRKNTSTPERLVPTAPLVGAFSDDEFWLESADTALKPGDLLVIYTDGLREQPSPAGDEFGEERLVRCVLDHRDAALEVLGEELESEVMRFADSLGQLDDMTQLMVRRVDDPTS